MSGPMILIPQPIPPGQRVEEGQRLDRPACDRCHRKSTERNPIILSERASWTPEHIPFLRRDAICSECRYIMRRH